MHGHPASRPGGPYLLGTDSSESQRLEEQHRVWAPETRDLWDRAGFGLGDRLLDLGCGPGFASIDLSDRAGANGRVLAVDESKDFIESLQREARRLGLERITARVERVEQIQLEPDSLDGAFARWLFCFVADPGTAIGRVVSGLRPGGRLVIWDYLNYRATRLQPPGPAFDRVLEAVAESFRRTGGDLDVGGRLPGLVEAAGCRVLELVPIVRYAKPGTALWTWAERFFFHYVPRLVEAGLLSAAEQRGFESEWKGRERDPGTFLSTPPMVGIIAEKR